MAAKRAPAPVLSVRALNRALLHRQLLLARAKLPAARALKTLVGLQAQTPDSPYVGLWSRLDRFRPEDLSRLIEDRRAVRIALMRTTLHLVSATDARAIRPVVQPVLDRGVGPGTPHVRALKGMDLAPVLASGRALLEERPRTLAELRSALHARWPRRDAGALGSALHHLLPLVQVPPRGLWRGSGHASCTTLDHWLGAPLGRSRTPEALILRYLAAFGPASVADVQAWSGLRRLGDAMELIRPRLRTFRTEQGRELFDLPQGALPDPETPAPIRFLPDYDNAVLGFAHRARIFADADRPLFPKPKNGVVPGTLLVDGFVQGTWKIARGRDTAVLQVNPFRPLSSAQKSALLEEGEDLLAFLAPEAAHDLQLAMSR